MSPLLSIAAAPGPRGPALRATLSELRREPLVAFSNLAARFGPIASIAAPAGGAPLAVISDPDVVRKVLVDQRGYYSKHTATYARLREIVGAGILTTEGDDWRFQRRLVTPCLHAARQDTLLAATAELTRELGERWQAAARSGDAIDLRRDMAWLTLSVLARSLFDADARETASEVATALDVVLAEGSALGAPRAKPPVSAASRDRAGRLQVAVGKLEREIARIAAAPVRARRPWNLVLALLAAAQGRCPVAAGASAPPSHAVLLTMYLAGHETTASTLSWAAWLLSRHPKAAARLRAEAARELVADGDVRERVERLHFTRAVLHEALRLYPPVWLLERRAERDHELAGYRVEAGTTLALCLYAAQRNAEHWPAPDDFIPERFLAHGARRRLLAFGTGPRGCAGAAFALDEMTLALATLTRSFRLSVETAPVPYGGLTLRTREPLLAKLCAA